MNSTTEFEVHFYPVLGTHFFASAELRLGFETVSFLSFLLLCSPFLLLLPVTSLPFIFPRLPVRRLEGVSAVSLKIAFADTREPALTAGVANSSLSKAAYATWGLGRQNLRGDKFSTGEGVHTALPPATACLHCAPRQREGGGHSLLPTAIAST